MKTKSDEYMEAPMKKVQSADITFSTEDMLLDRKKHNRPLYLTGYIGETRLPRVQIDPGSAINVMPLRALAYLGIPTSRLSHTKVTILGYNADSQRAFGKIRLKCQTGDLKTEVTCYVIDGDTSYNLLLGRPWIHSNNVVPSALHQCFKYVDEKGQVHRVFADKKPFI